MEKEFKQKLQEFEEKNFRHPHFSKKLAKQAERYIDFACKMADKDMEKTDVEKLVKKTERSELGRLLKHAKTMTGLKEFERETLNIYAKTQNRKGDNPIRAFCYEDLSICIQALEETKSEEAAFALARDLFGFIGDNCPQSLDTDYIKRTISIAATLLEADGKEITHFPKTEEDEWA